MIRRRAAVLLAAAALGLAALAVGFGPVSLWLSERHVEEWMIYRILVASLLTTASALRKRWPKVSPTFATLFTWHRRAGRVRSCASR